MTEATCLICDVPMTGSSRRRYCSKRCINASRGDRYYTERSCIVCGATWKTPKSDARFCSDLCRTTRPDPNPCLKCGSVDVRRGSSYCSQTCAATARGDRRGALRRALEDGTTLDVIAAVLPHVLVDPSSGCWM